MLRMVINANAMLTKEWYEKRLYKENDARASAAACDARKVRD